MSRVANTPDAPAPVSSAGSRVNRPALAAALSVGHSIGILPVCFLIDGSRLTPLVTLVVIALTALIVLIRPTTTLSTARPRPKHYVMATASASFHGVVAGFMWLALYYMAAGVIWLLRATIGWPAVPSVLDGAVTPSLIVAAPFVVAALAQGYREVADQLCPDRAGVETLYETALTARQAWILTGVVLATGVLTIGAAVLQYHPYWLALVLMFVTMLASSPLATLSSSEKRPVLRDVTDATRRVLQHAGYEVLQAPRTGDASVDPLLADLSLYVRAPGKGRAFAIDIKASPTSEPLDWAAASSLKLKVSALTNIESRDKDTETIDSITPVLVALTAADDSLREFASDHRVMLFELAPRATAAAPGPAPAAPAAPESFSKGPSPGTSSATSKEAEPAALSHAALRAAAANVPEMVRAFITESTAAPASSASAGMTGVEG